MQSDVSLVSDTNEQAATVQNDINQQSTDSCEESRC